MTRLTKFCLLNTQTFNDFIEITREAVSGISVEKNGVKRAAFSEEEAIEIIVAQVSFLLYGRIFKLFYF